MIEDEGPLGIADDREVVELWSSLRREIRRRGVDPETADDLAQESWLRTLRAPPERDGRGIGGWLHVVGARLVSEFRRSSQNRLARERRVARGEATHDVEDGETRIERLVAELPSPYREVVYLRFYEDRGLAEIARELGRPTVTVRSQLARGLERLRVRLGEEDWRPWKRALALVGFRAGRWSWPRLLANAGVALVALVAGVWWFADEERGAERGGRAAGLALAPLAADEVRTARQPALDSAPSDETKAAEPGGERDAAPAGRFLAGSVRAFDGTPVAGATLLGGARRGDGRALGTSDAFGRYALAAVPPESFVWVAAEGSFDSRRLYVRSLAAGKEHDFELPADFGALDVRVREPDGRPADGLALSFLPVGAADRSVVAASGGLEIAGSAGVLARTDASGQARFRRPREAQLLFLGHRAGRLVLREVVELEVDVQAVELSLPQLARVTGQLRAPNGAAAVGAEVVARQRDLEVYLRGVTDARGRFAFEGLVPGEVTLQAALPESQSAVQWRGELADGEVRELVLDAEARMAIAGTAADELGPLADARVALYREGRHGLAADEVRSTASDGAFLFWVDPELEYWLELSRADGARACGVRRHVRGGERVELAPMDELESTATLTLHFRAERPELLPTAVKLRSIHPRISLDAEVDADGRARVELPRTPFELAVWVPGVGFWRRAEPFMADGGELDVLLPRPARLELRLDLPRGVSAPARVGVRMGGLNPFGFEALGAILTEVALTADAERRFFSGELFPAKASYFAEIAGFSTSTGALELVPGELSALVLRPHPARRVALTLELPRALLEREAVELVAHTASGPVTIPLAETQRTSGRIQLVIELPHATETLACTTSRGLAGEVVVGVDSPRRLSLPLR